MFLASKHSKRLRRIIFAHEHQSHITENTNTNTKRKIDLFKRNKIFIDGNFY